VTRDKVGAMVKDINNAHGSIEKANKMIEKAREMINKAEAMLAKTIPIHEADSKYLEELTTEKEMLREEEAKASRELAQVEAHLATLAAEFTDEMKREAAMKAKEERRRRMLSLEDRLKSYANHHA
jgi:chromosome segregation ATPase